MRLKGTVVNPARQVLTLEAKSNKLLLNNQFDSVVVFTEFAYLGRAADNPEDTPLPIPDGLLNHPCPPPPM